MMERLKIYMPGIGTWRFFLSFLVAISHLYGNMIHGPAAYAVWGFCLERFFNVPRSDKKIWIFSIRAQRLRTKPIPAYLSFIYLFRDIGHRRSFCSEKVPF